MNFPVIQTSGGQISNFLQLVGRSCMKIFFINFSEELSLMLCQFFELTFTSF